MNPIESILKHLFPGAYGPNGQLANSNPKAMNLPADSPTQPKTLQEAVRYMTDRGWTKAGAASPTPAPVAAAQSLATQPQQEAFKYVMGKSDYSNLKPQVEAALKGSPLEPYANDFIKAANTHKVDPRVLVTIANNESSMGRNYPQDSYNPFGYLVDPTTGHGVEDVYTGLRNAGFTSLPMAIDRLTGRFERQPTPGYQQFYQNPTIENLQAAYNANPNERDNYLKNAQALAAQRFQP